VGKGSDRELATDVGGADLAMQVGEVGLEVEDRFLQGREPFATALEKLAGKTAR
jgi:hypothetical protein